MFRLLFIGIFFLCGSSYWSQAIMVHFEGSIYDEKENTIKGAIVKVTKGEIQFNVLKSDENGSYNLYLPLDDEFNVTVTKPGFAQKKYTVSTKNIPVLKSQIQFATNVADVVLFTKYDNVDYSLFDNPMNKYYYNKAKDNIVYDDDYLKEMKLAMKNFKNAQQEATKIAEEKANANMIIAGNLAREKAIADKIINDRKILADKLAAAEKAKEDKLLNDKLALQKLEADKLAKENELQAKKLEAPAAIAIEEKPDKTLVAMNAVIKKDSRSPKTLELLSKYKPGVTEEIFESTGLYVVQRVLVRDDMVWVYQKKIFSWGGIACFRDKERITEGTFESETKKI